MSSSFPFNPKKVRSATETVSRKMNPRLTQQVRRRAVESGWPFQVARTLRVNVFDEDPIPLSPQAMDWEFGTQSRPPIPVVRQFLADNPVAEVFETNLSQELARQGVVL
jgi:hypothetical protein